MIMDCRVRIANERKSERRETQGNVLFHKKKSSFHNCFSYNNYEIKKEIWYIDSRATQHMTSNENQKVHEISLYC
jgi:hypothetical protein